MPINTTRIRCALLVICTSLLMSACGSESNTNTETQDPSETPFESTEEETPTTEIVEEETPVTQTPTNPEDPAPEGGTLEPTVQVFSLSVDSLVITRLSTNGAVAVDTENLKNESLEYEL